jgi:anti-sigma regulatory factor (Ser/Thr protein kinase)
VVVDDMDFDASTLPLLRQRVKAYWAAAGMPEGRASDFILAVHELAANAVRHGAGSGRLLMSTVPGGLRAVVSDAGPGPRPWALRPGHGLWIVDQVADEVDVSSEPGGFRVTAVFSRHRGPGR